MVENCRKEIGASCFSLSRDDHNLWNRHGGSGDGLCIEIDVPDRLLSNSFFYVSYVTEKIFHINSIIESALFSEKAFKGYKILLTKTKYWEVEKEIRIITKLQNISMDINGSITEIIFGNRVLPSLRREIITKIDEYLPGHSIIFTESRARNQ